MDSADGFFIKGEITMIDGNPVGMEYTAGIADMKIAVTGRNSDTIKVGAIIAAMTVGGNQGMKQNLIFPPAWVDFDIIRLGIAVWDSQGNELANVEISIPNGPSFTVPGSALKKATEKK